MSAEDVPFQQFAVDRFRFPSGLEISQCTPHELIDVVVAEFPPTKPCVLLAAHVTTLNAWDDPELVRAFQASSGNYVDGVSISVAGRMYGVRLHKLATTDFAPELMSRLGTRLARPVRVAVIGGEPGTAAAAGARLADSLDVDVVLSEHGYHADWSPVLSSLRELAPDVVILGLGMPLEAQWLMRHHQALPPASIVVTCGGWLRLLTEDESRSPLLMQRLQLEWLFRLATNPGRTNKRYALGAWNLMRLGAARMRGSGAN